MRGCCPVSTRYAQGDVWRRGGRDGTCLCRQTPWPFPQGGRNGNSTQSLHLQEFPAQERCASWRCTPPHPYRWEATTTKTIAASLLPYADDASPPYFFIKPMWKSRILLTIWSIASSVGRKVVRMWKVPSACPKPDPGTTHTPVASSSSLA